MRYLGSFALVMASALASALLVVLTSKSILPSRSPSVGIYEVEPGTAPKDNLDLSIAFFDWNDKSLIMLLNEFLRQSRRDGRIPLVNLEPFVDSANGRLSKDLLTDVQSGRYDKQLDGVRKVLAKEEGPVLLRFGHEMDRTGQYPWSFHNPHDYIKLYRYVHDKLTTQPLPQIRWVWSPGGSPHADRFWPGHAYVDIIGISIYSSRAWTKDRSLESFSLILRRNLWLQSRFNRPLLVAESGVSGSAEDQQEWVQEAIDSLPRFPAVCGVVYFHAPQPTWMPLPTGHEDWSLKNSALSWFLSQLPLASHPGLRCAGA